MLRFLWVFLLACGPSGDTQSGSTTGGSDVVEPNEPATTVDEPGAEPLDEPATADATENETPMQYYIDGEQVDEATFRALHSRLRVEPEAFQGETVENPDGSYGGSSESFRATDGDAQYIYTSAVFRGEDDTTTESRSLSRSGEAAEPER